MKERFCNITWLLNQGCNFIQKIYFLYWFCSCHVNFLLVLGIYSLWLENLYLVKGTFLLFIGKLYYFRHILLHCEKNNNISTNILFNMYFLLKFFPSFLIHEIKTFQILENVWQEIIDIFVKSSFIFSLLLACLHITYIHIFNYITV